MSPDPVAQPGPLTHNETGTGLSKPKLAGMWNPGPDYAVTRDLGEDESEQLTFDDERELEEAIEQGFDAWDVFSPPTDGEKADAGSLDTTKNDPAVKPDPSPRPQEKRK